ncbi:MAG: VanZ family protein [Terriglobales bacterium]
MLNRIVRAWLPVVALCAIIFALSQDANSGRHSDEVLRWLLDLFGIHSVRLQHLLDPGFRKFAHVFIYFCLAALTYRGFALGRVGFQFSAAVRSLIFSAVYAATDEYHQSFIATRGPEPRDVAIDTAGALLALLLIWLVTRPKGKDGAGGNEPTPASARVIESP